MENTGWDRQCQHALTIIALRTFWKTAGRDTLMKFNSVGNSCWWSERRFSQDKVNSCRGLMKVAEGFFITRCCQVTNLDLWWAWQTTHKLIKARYLHLFSFDRASAKGSYRENPSVVNFILWLIVLIPRTFTIEIWQILHLWQCAEGIESILEIFKYKG